MTNSKAYIPVHALCKFDLESILSIAAASLNNQETQRRVDYHNSRRTMLYFLLSMYATPNNQHLIKWIEESNWKQNQLSLQESYNNFKNVIEPYKKQYRAEKFEKYWELGRDASRSGPKQSRSYISRYREKGFEPKELKIYWNYDEIRELNKTDRFNPITDTDTNRALLESPVDSRRNSGIVKFIHSGIEDAVFLVPEGKQIIVLDFADERMPGGYFLENARTQEEVILYNSDGYRALLDLKYQMMDEGYMLPEYGVAYIKQVRFFQEKNMPKQECVTDLIVAACYDLSGMGEGLYKLPSDKDFSDRTYQKFQSIIASAVANTEGNGKDTYLLLGPIGTGAFANDKRIIAELFAKVLNGELMCSKGAIRYAFDQIWFVSTDSLDTFVKVFEKKEL